MITNVSHYKFAYKLYYLTYLLFVPHSTDHKKKRKESTYNYVHQTIAKKIQFY